MILTFLGTGTSTGVPQLRCHCPTCSSTDARDRRLRASVLIRAAEGAPAVIIDCGPDFRAQMLRHDSPELCAALITHIHYDHVGGIDDLRPYCADKPDHHFPVYCREDVAAGLRHNFPYSFAENPYPGVPTFDIHYIEALRPFDVPLGGEFGNLRFTPLPVMHARLPIFGYRCGNLAYITDCSGMPAETKDAIRGVDTLVINALRPQQHMSHLSLAEALAIIEEVKPGRAYLTHMSHDMPPVRRASRLLPTGVHFACDNLEIEVF